MRSPAGTPEELETLLEDAFIARDRHALALLFEDGAVLVTGERAQQARGADAIGLVAEAMWKRGRTYLADPRRVVQTRDTALVLTGRGASVVRREGDRGWRYAISLINPYDREAP